MKSKSYRYLFAGFLTILVLPFLILSCSSSSGGDDDPPAAPATIPAVVFIADKDNDEVFELYVSLNDGDTVLKLSGTMVLNGDVIDFKISPNGSRVAYRADQDTPGVIELYVNSIDGGTPVLVSGFAPLSIPDYDVEVEPNVTFDAFNWSPDSSLIAYIAD